MNPLSENPALTALGNQLRGDTAAPAPASAVSEPKAATPSPAQPTGNVAPTTGRLVSLPYWLALTLVVVAGLYVTHRVIYTYNWNSPFSVSDKLDHQGAWYRQAALAPVDWVRSRQYYIQADFWGNKKVVYVVGDRQFVQDKSGEPAIELYSSK